jgi:hypothetical protein
MDMCFQRKEKMGQEEERSRPTKKKTRRVCPTWSGYGFFPEERRTPRLVGSSPSAAREHHDLALLPVVPSQLVEDLPSHRINAGFQGPNDVQPQSLVFWPMVIDGRRSSSSLDDSSRQPDFDCDPPESEARSRTTSAGEGIRAPHRTVLRSLWRH